jgi:hypothetical protein
MKSSARRSQLIPGLRCSSAGLQDFVALRLGSLSTCNAGPVNAKSPTAILRRGSLANLWCGRPACTCSRDGRTTIRALVPESRSLI